MTKREYRERTERMMRSLRKATKDLDAGRVSAASFFVEAPPASAVVRMARNEGNVR